LGMAKICRIDTIHPSDGVTVTVISGESHGTTGFVRPVGGCWYFDFKLSKPGAEVFQPIPEGWTGFIYSEYSTQHHYPLDSFSRRKLTYSHQRLPQYPFYHL
jgi:hypothetical protein